MDNETRLPEDVFFRCEGCRGTSAWIDTDDRFALGRALSVICWGCELVLATFDSAEELLAAVEAAE